MLVLLATTAIIAVVLLSGSDRSYWRFTPAGADDAPRTDPDGNGDEVGRLVRVDDIVVRLQTGDDEPHYLSMEFDLELTHGGDCDSVAQRLPKIRDAAISYLADRGPNDLRGTHQRESLKRDLLDRIGSVVPGRPLKALYISNLVIQ